MSADSAQDEAGPLAGIRVIEMAGLGPGPFGGMMLSDFGADVLRIDRAEEAARDWSHPLETDVSTRGRRSVAIDLKRPGGVEVLLRLVDRADVLIDPYRPGVAERLGFGPDACCPRNPRLVYARMTGFGQDGPLADRAGHDINYIALSGALGALGPDDRPPLAPLNLVGDFGGGGTLLAVGILTALLERTRSGEGQVVDCSMVEGSALLLSHMLGPMQVGTWPGARGRNLLDGGAPFYAAYETADGGFVAFGAIEPRFYAQMLAGLGLHGEELPGQDDRDAWPDMKRRVAEVVRGRTRAEWERIFADLDACFTPVLGPLEAPDHPHNTARGAFLEVGGLRQPAPAPRFSRTPGRVAGPGCHPGQHTREALRDWGFGDEEIEKLARAEAVRQSGASGPRG